MRSQCYGQRKSLNVKLNWRPVRRRGLIKKLTVASEGDKNVNLFLELRETFVTLGTEFLGITATDVTVVDPGRPRGPRPPPPLPRPCENKS